MALLSRRLIFIFTAFRTANVTGSDLSLNALSQGLLTIRHTASSSKKICNDTVQRIANFLVSLSLSRSGSFHQFPPSRFCVVWYQGFSNTRWKEDERIETTEDDITISSSYMSHRNVHNTRNTAWLVAYNKGKRNAILANSFTSKQKRSFL